MPHYRAYILDEQGHVVGAVDLDCDDDDDARERVKQLRGEHVELWRQIPLLEAAVRLIQSNDNQNNDNYGS